MSFMECSSLKRISIPSSVTYIGSYSFNECSALERISIPSSVTYIGSDSFYSCASLKKIVIPLGIKTINEYFCAHCHSLSQISIPPSVKTIKNHAFIGCNSLNDRFIPSSVILIDSEAFKYQNKSKLESLIGFAVFPFLMGTASTFWLIFFSYRWLYLIHPWFAHGYKTGKIVYQLLQTCMISSICFSSFFLCYMILYALILKKTIVIMGCTKTTDALKYIGIIILISTFLISDICGFTVSLYAFKNEVNEGKSYKCMRYMIEGYQGAENWVSRQSLNMQNEFKIWYNKTIEKALDDKGEITNYYCSDAGLFILILSLLFPCSIIFILLLCAIVTPFLICGNK